MSLLSNNNRCELYYYYYIVAIATDDHVGWLTFNCWYVWRGREV
jgi:hypothetical protein